MEQSSPAFYASREEQPVPLPDPFWPVVNSVVAVTLFWFILFYVIAFAMPWMQRYMPESPKKHENDRWWLASHLNCFLMSLLVAGICVPAAVRLSQEPPSTRYMYSRDTATCSFAGQGHSEAAEFWGRALIFAGLNFMGQLLADVWHMWAHGLGSTAMYAHHVVFLVACVIVRLKCVLPYTAALMMSAEASTVCLEYYKVFRHRGSGYKTSLFVTGIGFIVLFVVGRLVVGTYAVCDLILNTRAFLFPIMPEWVAVLLNIVLVFGIIMQYIWFPQVLGQFKHFLTSQSFENGESAKPSAKPLLHVS